MELLDESRECFATVEKGYKKLESLDEAYPAWVNCFYLDTSETFTKYI